MQVSLISGSDVQGKAFTHELTKPIVVFTGANGAGKTTRLKAVDLALRGPKKDDSRFGDKASVHLRLKVPKDVTPQCTVEVLRALSPKHTLSVQPLVPPGSKSVTAAQGTLDNLVQMPTVTFDLDAFVKLSPDKQKSALMPFARFIPATEYADVYPAVAPFDGEAGSDYLGRVRAAISEECKALAARKLAAERAQVELAQSAGHNARTADVIRIDIGVVEHALGLTDALRQATEKRAVALNHLSGAKSMLLSAVDRLQPYIGDAGAQLSGKTSMQLRAELSDIEGKLAAWMNWQRWDADRQKEAHNVQAVRQRLEQASYNLDAAGGGAPWDEPQWQQVLAGLERGTRMRNEMTATGQQLAGVLQELAGVRVAQLEPLALVNAIDAAIGAQFIGPAGVNAVQQHVQDLRSHLLLHGFPNAPRLESERLRLQASIAELGAWLAELNMPALQTLHEQLQHARSAEHVRQSLVDTRSAASTELLRAEATFAAVNGGQPPAPTGTDVERLRLLAARDTVTAEVAAAQHDEQKAANADAGRKQAETDVANARARVTAAEAAQQEAIDKVLWQESCMAQIPEALRDVVLHDHLSALKRELDEAVRAEGKVQAEREAYANAESAKLALDAAKAAEKRAKTASDECLRKSLGAVADAFQPFCTMLGGTWQLGDDRPLGLDRAGRWIDFELLSESERLVYGIGLVLALSTLGKGLRLVMLDGLDSCDVGRRRAIVAVAAQLIAAGKLDNVLGTAWSPDGFDGELVQTIGV